MAERLINPESVIKREHRTVNIKRFERNRERFFGLVFDMENEFTRGEFLHKFNESGDTIIDSSQTPNDLLQDLVDYGVIREEFGICSIR